MLRAYALLICLLQLAGSSRAQPFVFQHYTLRDGLSNSNVECIAQDTTGFIWVGTQSGLNRFDGYGFKNFSSRYKDSSALSNNWIATMHTDSKGEFWVATRDGLNLYHSNTETFSAYKPDSKADFFVSGILEDKPQHFYLSTNKGFWAFDADKKIFQKIPVGFNDSGYFFTAIKRRGDQILLGSLGGLWVWQHDKMFNLHVNVFKTVENKSDMAIEIVAANNRIFILTWAKGVFEYVPPGSLKQVLNYNAEGTSIPNDIAQDLLSWDSHHLLIATFGGLCLADPDTKECRLINHDSGRPGSLASDYVNTLFRDRQGIIWVGTDKGLDKYDPAPASQLETLLLPASRELQGFNDIIADRGQNFWIASYGGLFQWQKQGNELICYNHLLSSGDKGVFSLLREGDALWAGGLGVLYSFTIRNDQLLRNNSSILPVGSSLTFIHRFSRDQLLLGTYGSGLFLFDLRSKTFSHFSKELSSLVSPSAIHQDQKGNTWISSNGNGIAFKRSNSDHWILFHPDSTGHEFPDRVIISMAEDKHGNMWAGTLSNGLVKLTSDSSYEVHDTHNGFPASRINVIVPDRNGIFWMLTSAGLVSFDPATNKSRLYSGPGFPEPNIFLSTLSASPEGVFYVGDEKKLISFKPEELSAAQAPPQTIITGFRIFDKSQPLASEVKLDYDQNYFTFDFTGIDFRQTSSIRYQYQMQGVDADWINAGDRRVAAYSNLAAGRYIFLVRAINADGGTDATPASITILIRPPFWQTWWFISLCVLGAAAILYLIYRIRIDRILALQRVRNRIARDLHDDVGSTLSSINILSSMAEARMDDDRATASGFIHKISDSSQKMMQNMRDIVWAVNPEHDSMEQIISYMRQYLAATLESQQITFSLNADPSLRSVKLDVDKRRDFYLIFKEAVNNVAKYAAAKNVAVRVRYQGKKIILTVSDDGKGFDETLILKGNGLNNMRARAAAMKGVCAVKSNEGKGTEMELIFPAG